MTEKLASVCGVPECVLELSKTFECVLSAPESGECVLESLGLAEYARFDDGAEFIFHAMVASAQVKSFHWGQ